MRTLWANAGRGRTHPLPTARMAPDGPLCVGVAEQELPCGRFTEKIRLAGVRSPHDSLILKLGRPVF